MACTKDNIKQHGLNLWHDSSWQEREPKVDVVLVQGLNADPYYTWVAREVASDNVPPSSLRNGWRKLVHRSGVNPTKTRNSCTVETFWPKDLLPTHLPCSTIATYSYPSSWFSRDFKTSLRVCGEQFLNVLYQQRLNQNSVKRPLILVGHSLGALVIQQALVIADHGDDFINIRESIKGAVFLGGPLMGCDAACLVLWAQHAVGLDQPLLRTLSSRSQDLLALSRDFWSSYGRLPIVCFYEEIETKYGPLSVKTVNAQSAGLIGKRRLGLNTNHSGLNKFYGEDDENFCLVLPAIKEIYNQVAQEHQPTQRPADGPDSSVRKTEDVWTSGNIHWVVTRPLNALFTGRVELLDSIESVIRQEMKDHMACEQRRIVITGMGGQGKSEICLQIAHHLRESFWGVFWIDVSSPTSAEAGFSNVASRLGNPTQAMGPTQQHLANVKSPWLLILDNADDLDFDYQAYIPAGQLGFVLITSRNRECDQYATTRREVLAPLVDRDGIALLLKATRIHTQDYWAHEQNAQIVCNLLGAHPLALIQAGSFIARGHCTLQEYPEVYKKHRKHLLQFRPVQARSRYGDIYATFEASASILSLSEDQAANDALRLLSILSMLGSNRIPLAIFEAAWFGASKVRESGVDEESLWSLTSWHVSRLPLFVQAYECEWQPFRLSNAVSILKNSSFVTEDVTEGTVSISMHSLAHAWAKDRQDQKQQEASWLATACILSLSQFHSALRDKILFQLRPHLRAEIDVAAKDMFQRGPRIRILQLVTRFGLLLSILRDYEKLAVLYDDVFDHLKLDKECVVEEMIPLYTIHAENLRHLRKPAEAIPLLESVIDLLRGVSHPHDQHLLVIQRSLATAYSTSGQLEEAISIFEEVAEIEEQISAEDHRSRLAARTDLALAYAANGDQDKALVLLENNVAIYERSIPSWNYDRLYAQRCLGKLYTEAGKVKAATDIFERTLAIQEKRLPEDDKERLELKWELGQAYWMDGQEERALRLMERVAQIRRHSLAEDHPDRILTEETLSLLYESLGRCE